MSDMTTYLKAENGQVTLSVDKFDDEHVWVSIRGNHGGAYCSISNEEARKMIEGLKRILGEA